MGQGLKSSQSMLLYAVCLKNFEHFGVYREWATKKVCCSQLKKCSKL